MTQQLVTKKDIELVKQAETQAKKVVNIKTDKDIEKAAVVLITLKKEVDTLEDKRKSYVKPTQESIDTINADFKQLTEPRNTFIKTLKEAVVGYASSRKKDLKDKEKALQIELKDRSLVLDSDMNRVFCDIGELRFKKGYKYKITNTKKLPAKYWVIDESAILKDIKDAKGQIDIPGVKVVEESIDSVAIYPDK